MLLPNEVATLRTVMSSDEKSGSTYRVKAFVEGLRAARQARETRERDPRADILYDVLAEQSRELRAKYPEIYAKVDRIKAQPGRQTPRYKDVLSNLPEPEECLWCGDFIPPDQSFCSMPCALDYKSWTAQRLRPTRDCPVCGKAFALAPEHPEKKFCSRLCYRDSLK